MELPKKFGGTPLKRLANFYSNCYYSEFGLQPTVNLVGKDGGVLKSILKDNDEMRVAAFIVVHFNWRGVDNNREEEYINLRDNAFPLSWLSTRVNQYNLFLNKIIPSVYSSDKEFVKSYYKSNVSPKL